MLAQQPETLPLSGGHAQVGGYGFVEKNHRVAQLAAHPLSMGRSAKRSYRRRFSRCHLSYI
jgi:hypothetical protein